MLFINGFTHVKQMSSYFNVLYFPVPQISRSPSSSTFCLTSVLQQHDHSGGEDAEAGHHDGRGLHGRGQRHEDAAARAAGAALRCRHQDTTHLHHHRVHVKR